MNSRLSGDGTKGDYSKMDKPLAASTLNKVLAFGLAMTLVVWTFGVFFVLPAQAVDAHPDGTLVLSGSTVFLVSGGQRLGFPSANVFFSQGRAFSQVVSANSADLALPQGANQTFADGTLVNDGGTVYLISGGQKRGFTTAAVFTGLGYKFSNDLSDSLSSYTQGANVDSTTAAHPAGTLVNASGTIWQITSSGRSGIPSEAVFNSQGFSFAKTVPANAADLALTAGANLGYRVGSIVNDGGTIYVITSSDSKKGFPSASCYTDLGYAWSQSISGSTAGYTAGDNVCAGGGGGTAGTLTVSLASDTPASGIVIMNSARASFTKVALSASGGDVTVDSWVVKRVGVGQDLAFSSIDIVDLSTNSAINDSGKTFSTEHTANFTEDLLIPSGTTKYVTLSGNMLNATTYSGEQPALALQSITVKSGTVSGTFPITGNAMTINTSITIGTATVQRGAYSNATSTALEVGKTDYAFFSFSVGAGSAEDVLFSQVKIYQNGTASLSTDLKNLKLYRDGTFLADGTVSGNYVNFTNFAETQLLKKGQTSQYQVKADVASGSARTVYLAIYRATDMLATGQTYFAGITPTYTGTGAGSGTLVLTDNQATISQGTLRVGRSNTVAAGNIAVGNDQVLGAFEFEAKGEPIIVSAITMIFATSTTGGLAPLSSTALQSVKLVDSTGKTVAGPTDPTEVAFPRAATTFTLSLSDTFTVPVGINVYQVVGTLATNGSWSNNETVTASVTPSSGITAKGETTGLSITPSPTSSTTASTQTVKAAKITVTKNSIPSSKSVIVNSTNILAGSWTFDATDSGENVRITSIAIRASTTAKFNTLTLKDVASPGATGGSPLSPVNNAIATASAVTTSTFALTTPLVVTKGTSRVIDLYVNVPSNAVAGEVDSYGCNSGCLTSYGVTTGNTATNSYTNNDGALLTVAAAGTLTINVDASALGNRQLVFGTTGVDLAQVRLKATNESIDITKLIVRVADGGLTGTAAGDYTQIKKLYLKLDGAVIGDSAGYSLGAATTQVNFSRNTFTIPDGTTGKKLSLIGDLVNVGTNEPGTAGADITVGLNGANGFTAYGNGSNSTATKTYTDSTGSAVILHKAVPSVVLVTPTNKLGATSVVHEAKISAVGGTVGIYRLSYDVTSSTGIRLTNGYIKLAADCCGFSTGAILSDTTDVATVMISGDGHDIWSHTFSNTVNTSKRYLGIAAGETATVDFTATVSGFTTGTDSVSVSLLGDTASSSEQYTTGVAPAATWAIKKQGYFVWSDLNANDTQAAASLTTSQWYNGYLVSGLGATTTSTPVSVSE